MTKQIFLPAFEENNIPIVFNSSNEYIAYASVFIESILEHMDLQKNYDIIIQEKNVSAENKQKLIMMSKKYSNVSIRFFNMDKWTDGVQFPVLGGPFVIESYYRVFSPLAFENYHGKMIITDCDMVTEVDIAKLIDEELNGNIIGAVPDIVWHTWYEYYPHYQKYREEQFPIKNPYNYVNTGVMVVDCDLYRENFTYDKLVKYFMEHKFWIQEQDGLSLLLEGHIQPLSLSWNVYLKPNEKIKQTIDELAKPDGRNLYYTARENPNILHWASNPKPWVEPDVDLGEKWWKYARKTPFYEIIIKRMFYNSIKKHLDTIKKISNPNYDAQIGEDIYGRFHFPFEIVPPNSRIVIYGGGIVGKTFLRQIEKSSYCRVIALCDQNPGKTGVKAVPVIGLRKLAGMPKESYDLILIAIERRDIAYQICEDLMFSGIHKEKIKWINPHLGA